MGATTWVYFTAHHPKPGVALRRLRQEVFASGRYRTPPTARDELARARAIPPAASVHRQTAADMRAAAEAVRRNPSAVDTPLAREQMAAFARESGMNLPAGNPADQLIAFYEQQAVRLERMAEESESFHPRYLRFLDAVEGDTADGLPEDEARDFQRYRAVRDSSPTASRKFRETAGPPGSIAELLDRAGEDGTHSVLDITRVGRRATPGSAFPLRTEDLVREFGTAEPTRSQVEAAELSFAETFEWCAAYFAVCSDGQPVEWAFVGCSGD